MTVYIELHGIEPEDLEEHTGTGENRHDWYALANLVYGSINERSYNTDELREQLSHLDVTGVSTVVNPDFHEKFTGRRPEYAEDNQ